MKFIEGKLYYLTPSRENDHYSVFNCYSDISMNGVQCSTNDIVIYLGIRETEKYSTNEVEKRHCFFHQKSSMYIGWSVDEEGKSLTPENIEQYYKENPI